MLEDVRESTLDTIQKKKLGIEKDRRKISSLIQQMKNEPDGLKKWSDRIRIQHIQNAIDSKKDELKTLAYSLEMLDEAIESQKRDSAIIEANEHLPFPGELAAQILNLHASAEDLSERISPISGLIEPLVTFGNSLFRPQKKAASEEEPSSQSRQNKKP